MKEIEQSPTIDTTDWGKLFQFSAIYLERMLNRHLLNWKTGNTSLKDFFLTSDTITIYWIIKADVTEYSHTFTCRKFKHLSIKFICFCWYVTK
jgi:hypothetical protein